MAIAKKIIAGIAVGCVIVSTLAAPGALRQIRLQWDYPVAEIANVQGFNIYATNLATAPISSWPVYTNVPAVTNYIIATNGSLATFEWTLTPFATRSFLIVTAANEAGESPPSPSVAVPSQPPAPPSLRIR